MNKTVEEEQTNKDCNAFEDVVTTTTCKSENKIIYSISFQIQKIESFLLQKKTIT
jgi:hypothetical protein